MGNHMLAGVFVKEGIFELQQKPVPQVRATDEVIVEVEGCGLCGSDLHILSVPPGLRATPGVILGHEILGQIVDRGSDVQPEFAVGTRVAIDPNLKCGLCRYCRIGLGNHCERRKTLGIMLDGGFTRYVVAPKRALHPISKSVAFENAVCAEVLSSVVPSADRLGILPGQTAVIVGAGPVGVLHGMMLKAAGARVIISDVAPRRLEVAATAGLDVTVNVQKDSLVEVVKELTDGLGADAVVDAVGTQFALCLDVVARRGMISLFGASENAQATFRPRQIQRGEFAIFGICAANMFSRAIQLLEQGTIKPSTLVTHNLFLDQMVKGIEAARSGAAMKVVIRPTEQPHPERIPGHYGAIS